MATPNNAVDVPEDVEWEDGTVGVEVPEDIEWEDGTRGVDAAPAPPPESAPMPEAQPAAPPAPAPPPADPGFLRTVGRELLQGFFKQGADEAAGAIAAAGTDVLPGARYRMPDGTMRPLKDSGDVYRAVRDTERDIEAGAREHRPWASGIANVLGDVASDAALSAFGIPVASSGYQAASGALSGLLGNEAELTGDAALPSGVKSAIGSAAVGGALGYAAPKVGAAVARHAPGAAARFRQWLEEKAIDKARRVLTNGVDLNVKQPLPDSAVREALDSEAIDVWGTTKGAFQKLEQLAEERGANYGGIVDQLHAAGVQGPRVENVSRELLAASLDNEKNSGANKAVARAFEAEADNVRAVAPPGFNLLGEYPAQPVNLSAPAPATAYTTRDARGRFIPMAQRLAVIPDAPPPAPVERILTEYPTPIGGPAHPRLELNQAERIKRTLQREAKYGRIEDTPINEAKQEIASVYRKNIEDVIEEAGAAAPPGSDIAELASEFLPVKRQLSDTIAARDVAMRGAARAAQRSGASGISLFDLANATQAAGTGGLPAMALAGASRIWRERGPSTLANMYDVGAEAAGNFSQWAAANPGRVTDVATGGTGLSARRAPPDFSEPPPQLPQVSGGEAAQNLQRLLIANPEAFGPYARNMEAAAAEGPDAFARHDWMMAQTDPEYAETRRRAMAGVTGEQQ